VTGRKLVSRPAATNALVRNASSANVASEAAVRGTS
jgi:hypothetical protein